MSRHHPANTPRPHRFRIGIPVEARDPLGGRLDLWQEAGTLWARVERRSAPPSGPGLPTEVRITLGWRPGITAGLRLSGPAGTFLVRAVIDPDARRRILVCLCREEVP